jgi:hypothetical protein
MKTRNKIRAVAMFFFYVLYKERSKFFVCLLPRRLQGTYVNTLMADLVSPPVQKFVRL